MKKAMEESPWSIMGHCMVLKEWEVDAVIEEVIFEEICFWIQIHNVPIDMLTKVNAEIIGRMLGRVEVVEDPSGNGGFGKGFLRMRLGIEIGRVLVAGFWIPKRNRDRVWAIIKYEKLSDFYFSCGKLGHMEKGCIEEVKRVVDNQEVIRYGAHMRVVPIKGIMRGNEGREEKKGENVGTSG